MSKETISRGDVLAYHYGDGCVEYATVLRVRPCYRTPGDCDEVDCCAQCGDVLWKVDNGKSKCVGSKLFRKVASNDG
jgi:hypothetical protein